MAGMQVLGKTVWVGNFLILDIPGQPGFLGGCRVTAGYMVNHPKIATYDCVLLE